MRAEVKRYWFVGLEAGYKANLHIPFNNILL